MSLKVVGCSYQTNWSISETADLLVFYPEKQTSKKNLTYDQEKISSQQQLCGKKNILLMQDYRKAIVIQIMTFAEEHL